MKSSPRPAIIRGGRLSTQKKPPSSKAAIASDFPAPEWPVMITSVISRRARSSRWMSVSLANSVQLLVDLAPYFARQAGHRLELLPGGGEEPLRGAEVLEQGALAGRADSFQRVEDGAGHRPVAPPAVVFDREAVGLIADPLQELVALAAPRQLDRAQLWLYKESHAPARLIAKRDGHTIDLRLLEYGNPAAAEWFPRILELYRDGKPSLRFEVVESKGFRAAAPEEQDDDRE